MERPAPILGIPGRLPQAASFMETGLRPEFEILVQSIWAWVINPLAPGWGTAPEKTKFQERVVLPYIGICFLWFLVLG